MFNVNLRKLYCFFTFEQSQMFFQLNKVNFTLFWSWIRIRIKKNRKTWKQIHSPESFIYESKYKDDIAFYQTVYKTMNIMNNPAWLYVFVCFLWRKSRNYIYRCVVLFYFLFFDKILLSSYVYAVSLQQSCR